MNKRITLIQKELLLVLSWLFLGLHTTCLAQLHIVADRATATYEVGEQMHFNITTNITGSATYIIQYDERSPALETGTIDLVAGQTTRLPYTTFEPSFILCRLQQFGNSSLAGAAFSPRDIAPYEAEPADFDAFWNAKKAELAAIPMNPQVSFHSSTALSTSYRVNLANIDGRRVYGYLSIPNNSGPLPATLIMPSFGSNAGHVNVRNHTAEQSNLLTFALSIHNVEPDQTDPNAYQPNDVSSREGNYYKYALLGAVRAIDYIFTRPEFDGSNLMVMGVSQGGGLSVSVAGLDQRIKVLINSVSALCQHSGMRYGKASGHPYFIFKSRTENGNPSHEVNTVDATKYYDAMNFAKRFKGPSLTYMSYEDVTCPPGTVFAANNQLKGTKVIVHRREEGHDSPDYWMGRFDFIRKHIPGAQNAPVNPPNTTGHYANAGNDRNTSVGQAINLTGSVELNTIANTSFPVEWRKISGPGKVRFSHSEAHSTSATFSKAGTYMLQFHAIDTNYPTSEAKWITMADYIEVVVE